MIVSALAQIDAMPDSLISIFAQLPLVAVIVWLWLQTDKRQREEKEKDRIWLEHMLELQREAIKEAYESRDTFISQIDGEIRGLTQQLQINTATVNEIAKVDSVVSDLIDRLDRK